MLIGIDASRANRNLKSGVEWYSFYLIKELAKIDSQNEYLLYVDKPLEKGLINLKDDEEKSEAYDKDGYQIVYSPFNNFKAKVLQWPYNFFWTQGRMSLEMLWHAPDVLFIPSHTLPLIHPKHTILTLHDIGFAYNKNLYGIERLGPKKNFAQKLINFLVRIFTLGKYGANSSDYLLWSTLFGIKYAEKIITVSDFSKREIINFAPQAAKKITSVYIGVDTKLFRKIEDQKAIQAVLDQYGLNQPYLLCVGRIDNKKNILGLIDAFAIFCERHKDLRIKLVIAGKASYGYDNFYYQIKEHSLDDKIILPGWVQEKDMPYILNGAFALILPSKYEGFGMPLIQAMSCGVPIIASNIASIPEIAQKSALYFDPDNILEISEAIYKISTDNNLRQELIKEGYARVEKFDWNKLARQILDIIVEKK
jgi:glycosyltransferase involved in cell wall biosynthesis